MDHQQDQDQEPSQSLIGRVIEGRYQLQELVGEGAMGAVYRAEHTRMRKTVAVKILHASLTQSDELTERFRREAEAIAKIDHPNVCQAFDSGVGEDGSYYLVMEYLEGMSLADLLQRHRRLPVGLALRIFTQVLTALGRAHAVGIVHRDLKPDNIFLITKDDDPYFVKLVDFGIASLGDAPTPKGTRLTKAGMVYGTPQYLSPEQAVGAPIDHRSDLYAAGIVLYEMLCGQPPFDSDNIVQVISMHVTRPVPPLAEVCPEARVPPELEELLMSLLSKAANDRPASASEVLGKLEALQLEPESGAHELATGEENKSRGSAPTLAPAELATTTAPQEQTPATGDADFNPDNTGRLLIDVSATVDAAKLRSTSSQDAWTALLSSPLYLGIAVGGVLLLGVLVIIVLVVSAPERDGSLVEAAKVEQANDNPEPVLDPRAEEDLADSASLSTLRQDADTGSGAPSEALPAFASLPIAAELKTLAEIDPKLALERLTPLRKDYPTDEGFLFVLCVAESRAGEWTDALESVRRLLARNEAFIHDEVIFRLLLDAMGRKADTTASSASRILAWHLGDESVVDKLVQEAILGEFNSRQAQRKRIQKLLAENGKLELLAAWARAALELRLADGSKCPNRLKLLNTLIALDDPRAIPVVEVFASAPTTGCGGGRFSSKNADCHSCMRTHLEAGLAKLRAL